MSPIAKPPNFMPSVESIRKMPISGISPMTSAQAKTSANRLLASAHTLSALQSRRDARAAVLEARAAVYQANKAQKRRDKKPKTRRNGLEMAGERSMQGQQKINHYFRPQKGSGNGYGNIGYKRSDSSPTEVKDLGPNNITAGKVYATILALSPARRVRIKMLCLAHRELKEHTNS